MFASNLSRYWMPKMSDTYHHSSFRKVATRYMGKGRRWRRQGDHVTNAKQSERGQPTVGIPINKTEQIVLVENQSIMNNRWLQRIAPMRYRSSGKYYSREQLIAMATRLPLWLAISFFFLWDETAPFTVIRITGPSMIPTMAHDGSEVWLRVSHRFAYLFSPSSFYRVGDLVGYCHPNRPSVVSCKRIIGVAGDPIKRYGEYVHLYVEQDPVHWGQSVVSDSAETAWIDRSWDQDYCDRSKQKESNRVLVVPPGHVWLEGDCPPFSIDSRHVGPIPLEWLRGKLVARLWPLRHSGPDKHSSFRERPHPIPLDEESLARYNLRIVPK